MAAQAQEPRLSITDEPCAAGGDLWRDGRASYPPLVGSCGFGTAGRHGSVPPGRPNPKSQGAGSGHPGPARPRPARLHGEDSGGSRNIPMPRGTATSTPPPPTGCCDPASRIASLTSWAEDACRCGGQALDRGLRSAPVPAELRCEVPARRCHNHSRSVRSRGHGGSSR